MPRPKPKLWPIENVPDETQAKVKACKALLGKKTLDTMADITLASLQKK